MSDDLTFQDTPLYAWLRRNLWYLLGGVAVFLAILLFREKAPQWEYSGRAKSWDQYRALTSAPDGLEGLAQQLAEARKDDRIFEWLVYSAASAAADSSDEKALALLKPELESLAKTSEIMMAGSAGSQRMAAFLLESLYRDSEGLPKDPAAPEPQGGRIKISLSIDGVKTYDLILGLYEEQAPLGTSALKEWIAAGRFSEQTARRVGEQNLTIALAPIKTEGETGAAAPQEPVKDRLTVERKYGYFHSVGTLSPGMIPGTAGEQDLNNLQLALQNSYNMDGQTTVLAKVVQGLEELQAALDLAGPSATIKVVAAEVL